MMKVFTYEPEFNMECEHCYRQLEDGERYYSMHPLGRWAPRCLACEEIVTIKVIAATEERLQAYRAHLERVRAEIAQAGLE